MMRSLLPFLVTAFSYLLSSIGRVNSLSVDPSFIRTAGGPPASSSRSASTSSRRKYFGDVLTGGALIAATTTVAPEIAKADAAKVRHPCFERNHDLCAHPCSNDVRPRLTHLSCPFPTPTGVARYIGRPRTTMITTTGTHEDWTSLSRCLVQW
jgi:hypothetical protein